VLNRREFIKFMGAALCLAVTPNLPAQSLLEAQAPSISLVPIENNLPVCLNWECVVREAARKLADEVDYYVVCLLVKEDPNALKHIEANHWLKKHSYYSGLHEE